MLKQQKSSSPDLVKLTFALPLADAPGNVSVVGDFNNWNPHAHPLKRRSNGTRSVSVEVPAGEAYRFKYLDDRNNWFCEPDAEHEINEYNEPNSVVRA